MSRRAGKVDAACARCGKPQSAPRDGQLCRACLKRHLDRDPLRPEPGHRRYGQGTIQSPWTMTDVEAPAWLPGSRAPAVPPRWKETEDTDG